MNVIIFHKMKLIVTLCRNIELRVTWYKGNLWNDHRNFGNIRKNHKQKGRNRQHRKEVVNEKKNSAKIDKQNNMLKLRSNILLLSYGYNWSIKGNKKTSECIANHNPKWWDIKVIHLKQCDLNFEKFE